MNDKKSGGQPTRLTVNNRNANILHIFLPNQYYFITISTYKNIMGNITGKREIVPDVEILIVKQVRRVA